jgi:hypothetical protein
MLKKIAAILMLCVFIMPNIFAFDTLSLDKIDFNSNDLEIKGPAFLLYAVENGRSDYAEYSLSNLQSAANSAGYKLTGTGKITSELTEYAIEYPILNTQVPLLELKEWGTKVFFPWTSDTDKMSWCASVIPPSSHSYFVIKGFEFATHCYYMSEYGVIGEISTEPQIIFEDTITVSVSGKSPETVVLTPQNKVDETSNVVAKFVSMQGSTQGVPQVATQYGAIFTSNEIKLVSKAGIDAYRNHIKDGDILNSQLYDDMVLNSKNAIINFNNLRFMPKATYSSYNNNIAITGTNTGKITLTGTPIYQYPSFTLKIDAEWVGIFLPVGKPQIVSVESDCFSTGASGKVTAVIKNAGTLDASFDIGMICDKSFSPFALSAQKFKAGESKSIDIFMTAYSGSKEEGKCTLTVKDSSRPTIQASTDNINVCVRTAITCQPENSQRCIGDSREVCTKENDVLRWATIEQCQYGCEQTTKYETQCGVGFKCVTDSQCPEGYVCNDAGACRKAQTEFNWVALWLSIVLGLVLASIVGFKTFALWKGNAWTKTGFILLVVGAFFLGFFIMAFIINFLGKINTWALQVFT